MERKALAGEKNGDLSFKKQTNKKQPQTCWIMKIRTMPEEAYGKFH